jgi:signal transduction histidine kinase
LELTATTGIAIIGAAIDILLIWSAIRPQDGILRPALKNWLLVALIVAFLANLSFLLTEEDITTESLTTPSVRVLAMCLTMLLLSTLTIVYLQMRYAAVWFGAGVIWLAALVFTTATDENMLLGQENWIADSFSPMYVPGVIALGGWAVIVAVPMLLTFYSFSVARLSEIANRAIFWALTMPFPLMGSILSVSGTTGVEPAGLVIQAVGLLAITYAALHLRVLDVRQNLRMAVATAFLTIVSTITILVPLLILVTAEVEDNREEGVFAIGLAVLTAILLLILFNGFRSLTRRIAGQPSEDVPGQLHAFSEAIGSEVDLNELILVTLEQLRNILNAQRGGLILISDSAGTKDTTGHLVLNLHPAGNSELADLVGRINISSPIFTQMLTERQPVLQFDIDYNPEFRDVSEEERVFFKKLKMAAYAPIIAQGEVIALLAAGTKVSDVSYAPYDLEMLSTLANQMGIALRNARLVDDLKRREKEASDANRELKATKDQLEHLDSVKTDFITIASHELRTPLAQVRGYTDIIEALNTQGMLDPEQLGSMTGNLRKATDRMEELIRNMLDVSQIDVNAMDLRFTTVSIVNVVTMAIEPMTEAIRNRKQTLSVRGLRGLPEVEADMKRMVQAFQNVISNGVKFTPDGGRIQISGSVHTNPLRGRDEIVIAIEDDGIGVDEKNQDLIFEKFVRAQDPSLHSTGKTKFMGAGPGLGLTIARGVIEGHGGTIWVESERYDPVEMPGSCFYIVLPVKPPEDATGVMDLQRSTIHFDRDALMQAVKEASEEKK